jgi:hypothetical protein
MDCRIHVGTFAVLAVLGGAIGYLFWEGTGIWGLQIPNAWGLGDHQLRLVGWYRSRGNIDLRHFVFVPTKMENVH